MLASGAGTNLQAIIDHFEAGGEVEVVGVGSNKPDAYALQRARDAGIETATFAGEDFGDRDERDAAIGEWLDGLGVKLVVLAGYMELLSSEVVGRFRNRMINVHPALLPSFAGLDAIGQALRHGVRITGVTVHFVDEGVDSGPIILQRPVPVPPDGDREALERSIHATEHSLLPRAIAMIAEGRVSIDEANPRLVRVAPADGE